MGKWEGRAVGKYDLDNYEYDDFLARKKDKVELKKRHEERKAANKGYEGYHFGLGNTPVYTKDKEEFNRELKKRGLMLKDDVRRGLR